MSTSKSVWDWWSASAVENGAVIERPSERTIGQLTWADNIVVKTISLEGGSYERRVHLGNFEFDGDKFNQSQSEWKYNIVVKYDPGALGGEVDYLGNGVYKDNTFKAETVFAFVYRYPDGVEYMTSDDGKYDSSNYVFGYSSVPGVVDSRDRNPSNNKDQLISYGIPESLLAEGWWLDPFNITPEILGSAEQTRSSSFLISRPDSFVQAKIDPITNFKPSRDTAAIDIESFGIESTSFKSTRNRKLLNRLAKRSYDFVYNKSTGGLYFNENGNIPGWGEGGLCALFTGKPRLTSSNISAL